MTELLAYISVAFLGLRLIVVCTNTLFHFKNRNRWFDDAALVSILIPARNEEDNIGNILDCLIRQDYANIEIIVCDDHSDDSTPTILEEYSKRQQRIKWFRSEPLPDGWTGKNFACHQLRLRAKGEILLFTDADMHISGDIIARTAGYMNRRNLDLVSIFPKQVMKTTGEKITVPVMNWILLSLLPLPLVLFSRRSSFSAANGQFMMFNRDDYINHQYHLMAAGSPVEDIGIMKIMKNLKRRTSTLLGDTRVSCRMYQGYHDAINGFSKNILHFFSNSLIWTLFFLLFTTAGHLFVALWSLPAAIVTVSAGIIIRILVSAVSCQNVPVNLLLIPAQHIVMIQMVAGAFRAKSRGTVNWKGRKVNVKV